MIKCNDWPVGICTWSLKNDFDKINQLRDKLGLEHLNLALAPGLAADGEEYLQRIKKEGWNITATMMGFRQENYATLDTIKATGGIIPDDYWDENKQRLLWSMDVTVDFGVKYLAFHFGFLDHSNTEQMKIFTERVQFLADEAKSRGIMLLMETGQETAEDLKKFILELNHPAIGVNLDPANIILYDKGISIEAAKTLAPWIKHVHIKDATRTKTPGTWGAEVPWGRGEVDAAGFLNTLKEVGFDGYLAVEREAGDDRMGDITMALEYLKSF